MRTTIKIPMKTTDCQAVISTIAEVLEPHRYTRLELQDITIWHKKDKYFAVSFQNNTAHLQSWSEAPSYAASNEPLCATTTQLYYTLHEGKDEISLHSLRSPFAKKKQLKLLSKLEAAILEKNL